MAVSIVVAALSHSLQLLLAKGGLVTGLWGPSWPSFRRIWRVSSLVWGGALLGDAAVRIIMAYRLPVEEVPRLSGVLWSCTFVVIQVVTNLYYRRAGLWRLVGARWLQGPSHSPGGTDRCEGKFMVEPCGRRPWCRSS